MASTTPKNQRKRLTNDEKQKIIEDSKKPGLNIPYIVIIKHFMKGKSSW